MEFIVNLFSSDGEIFTLLFKLFAVVISVLYLIYAFIVFRQTKLMLRAIEESSGGFIRFISFFQILVAIFLIILSFGII